MGKRVSQRKKRVSRRNTDNGSPDQSHRIARRAWRAAYKPHVIATPNKQNPRLLDLLDTANGNRLVARGFQVGTGEMTAAIEEYRMTAKRKLAQKSP